MHLIRLHALNSLDDPADMTPVGYLGSAPTEIVTPDPTRARKFAGPSDAACYLESYPIPSAALLSPEIVAMPARSGQDTGPIRCLHDD